MGRTVTKKELVGRIAEQAGVAKVLAKDIIQLFLDGIVEELAADNRLEFRDFGVFETRERAPRQAQNPRTLDPVTVPARRTVKFKVGRVMRERVAAGPAPGKAEARERKPTPRRQRPDATGSSGEANAGS